LLQASQPAEARGRFPHSTRGLGRRVASNQRGATISGHIGWKAASNGARKRHWFVMHHEDRFYYANRRKQLVWFGSCKSAQEKAGELNESQQPGLLAGQDLLASRGRLFHRPKLQHVREDVIDVITRMVKILRRTATVQQH
jgi:hypothetical protein